MSSLESSKNLAGIGSILLILSFVPAAGWIIGIIGVILLLMGIRGLATYYQSNEIYSNALSGVIYYVIALVATGVALGGLAFGGMFGAFTAGSLIGIGLGIFVFVAALVVAFIFFLLASMRIRRSLSMLAQKTGEHLFETAGLIFFIGAILTIVFVGLALILVAWIMATIAFFSIRIPQQPYTYTQPTTPTSPMTQGQSSTSAPSCHGNARRTGSRARGRECGEARATSVRSP